MRYVEAPAFSQEEMLHLQLMQYAALGHTGKYHSPSTSQMLDPIAAIACQARSIGHFAEVGRRYFQERVFRTIRDRFRTEEPRRPCLMFLGEVDAVTKPCREQTASERVRRSNYVDDRPVFLRCENYRPFKQFDVQGNRMWVFRRAEQIFPVLIARLEDLKWSADGLLYCEVIGPKPWAYEETEEEENDHGPDWQARNDYQRSLIFPSWRNNIIIPMRDVEVSPELTGHQAFAQLALPNLTEDNDD